MAIFYADVCQIIRAGGAARGTFGHHTGTRISSGAAGKHLYNTGKTADLEPDPNKAPNVEHTLSRLPGGARLLDGGDAFAASLDAHKAHHKNAATATVARDFIGAFPDPADVPFTKSNRIAIAERWNEFVSEHYGVGVAGGMHYPERKFDAELGRETGSDPRNFHYHGLIAEYETSPDGKLGRKSLELDAKRCAINGWPNPAELMRAQWEIACNVELERAGSQERVSCLSNKERGIDVEPGTHRGAEATTELRAREREAELLERAYPGAAAYYDGLDRADARRAAPEHEPSTADKVARDAYLADKQAPQRQQVERRRPTYHGPSVASLVPDIQAIIRPKDLTQLLNEMADRAWHRAFVLARRQAVAAAAARELRALGKIAAVEQKRLEPAMRLIEIPPVPDDQARRERNARLLDGPAPPRRQRQQSQDLDIGY